MTDLDRLMMDEPHGPQTIRQRKKDRVSELLDVRTVAKLTVLKHLPLHPRRRTRSTPPSKRSCSMNSHAFTAGTKSSGACCGVCLACLCPSSTLRLR